MRLLIRRTRKRINVNLEIGNDERRLNGRLFYLVIKWYFINVFIRFSCNFIVVMLGSPMYSNRKLCYNENKKYCVDWSSVEIGQIY